MNTEKKNAAPAVAAVETAKNEFDKHSNLSIAEMAENVKYPYLIVEGAPDGIITTMNNLDGESFLQLYGAVVETIYATTMRAQLQTSELTKVEDDGKNRAFFRVLKEEF